PLAPRPMCGRATVAIAISVKTPSKPNSEFLNLYILVLLLVQTSTADDIPWRPRSPQNFSEISQNECSNDNGPDFSRTHANLGMTCCTQGHKRVVGGRGAL